MRCDPAFMGRETKILLGLLGLLAGVFVGLLSMKLLVPRPPAGAGPDIQAELADTAPNELVEPPTLTMRASDFAAAPPLVMDRQPPADPPVADRYAAREGGFGPPDAVAEAMPPPDDGSRRDPFVAPTAFEQPIDEPPADRFEPAAGVVEEPIALGAVGADARSPDPFSRDARPQAPVSPAVPPVAAEPLRSPLGAAATPAGSAYVVQPGDSWWLVAERAYGDGRFYRALFAWNRAIDPRVTLAPGTPLELPPLDKLGTAWPQLLPR
jgi:nucleoid-associated protein YgaU